jgi:pyruvate/2-oxoglutarate dehydrogenase complex dihydrolipoamide dehydrogenase (E3) component
VNYLPFRWNMGAVNEHAFDVVVMGLGPGGEYLAGELARAGVPVAGVEASLVGGECPYWGCVPSKMMIRAANLLAEGRRIPGMAGDSVISPAWAPVAKRIRDEATDNWDDKVAADRFTDLGGTLYRGQATITGPGTVRVGDDVLTARRGIVIGTGTRPAVPAIEGIGDTPYWTNHEAIETEEVPGSLLILGGGGVGAELAQVFSRFGSSVTVIEARPQLLPHEEPEAGQLITRVFRDAGIEVEAGGGAVSVRHDGGEFTVTLSDGRPLRGEQLLVATGRTTDLGRLGVDAIGLDPSARFIETDGDMLAAPGVWALGDVVGKGGFTHMSMYHAGIILSQLLGRPYRRAEYHAVPRVTFTDPEIGAVGLTEARAREQLGARVRTAIMPIPQSARGWIHKAGNDGFIKLVADRERGVLVGATSAGPAGGEVLSMLTLAVHAPVPVQRLTEMIYAYPTFHRAVSDTLDKLDLA